MEQWTPTGKPTGKFRDRGRTRDWSARYLCRFPFSVIDFLWRRSVKCRSLVFPAPFFFFFACVFLNYPLISFFPPHHPIHLLSFSRSDEPEKGRKNNTQTGAVHCIPFHWYAFYCCVSKGTAPCEYGMNGRNWESSQKIYSLRFLSSGVKLIQI